MWILFSFVLITCTVAEGFGSMKCMIASTKSKQLVVADRDVIILRLYMELKVVKPERN